MRLLLKLMGCLSRRRSSSEQSYFGQGRMRNVLRIRFVQDGQPNPTMKKLVCILASAALLGGCEQKSETVNPPADKKTESNTTVVNPASTVVKEKTKETTNTNTNTTTASSPPNSSTSTTTTTSSPSP